MCIWDPNYPDFIEKFQGGWQRHDDAPISWTCMNMLFDSWFPRVSAPFNSLPSIMEGCCERNFLKPSLNSTEFSLAMSEKIGSMFTYFPHLLSYLSSSTAFYNYHLLQFCISAVRLFSLLRPFSPCFRRAFKACLCYILHHLASSCQLWHLWYSNHSNAKHPSIGSVCFVCLFQSFSYLLPIGRLFIIVLVTSVSKNWGLLNLFQSSWGQNPGQIELQSLIIAHRQIDVWIYVMH